MNTVAVVFAVGPAEVNLSSTSSSLTAGNSSKMQFPQVEVEDKNGTTVDFTGFVYASPEFQEKSTVLLIIHGSGAVRPGQWSRRLILNESLEVGSQIPYIRRALVNDWGVIVCSTNTDEEFRDYPRHHLCSVYEQLLKDSTIQRFFVVAHSRGGPDIAHSLPHFKNENRFEVVCLTDSVGLDDNCLSEKQTSGGTVFINWKADSKLQSAAIADQDILEPYSRVHQIYAGTTEHERSSHTAFDSVFHVLEQWKGPDSLPKLLVEAAGLTSVSCLSWSHGDLTLNEEKRTVDANDLALLLLYLTSCIFESSGKKGSRRQTGYRCLQIQRVSYTASNLQHEYRYFLNCIG
ncbi:hypothetical protein ANCCAN_21536 [Ancylostoma caninum]|uniref:Arb2 domain-containing protein n=1 Tax=Ancylostoma caninum TaxID=29170 RepID=A0A368FMA3_ANCCA|nr:hypothetical protein ANCCAN_21536 [Ancylostoma caninum]